MLKIFTERLRLARMNRNQTDAAKILGISSMRLSNYESGKREPDLTFFKQIAEGYGVSSDWLLGLTETRTGAGPVVTATGGSAASGTGPATVHAPPAVAPPGPAETDRLLTIIESQQRVIENLSKRK